FILIIEGAGVVPTGAGANQRGLREDDREADTRDCRRYPTWQTVPLMQTPRLRAYGPENIAGCSPHNLTKSAK
ncbi:MAG: hypothetical protein M3P92_09405, partial [Actinomycetota bacterium]|nr:hypothetical protein [Actinomycetota bacterium]